MNNYTYEVLSIYNPSRKYVHPPLLETLKIQNVSRRRTTSLKNNFNSEYRNYTIFNEISQYKLVT